MRRVLLEKIELTVFYITKETSTFTFWYSNHKTYLHNCWWLLVSKEVLHKFDKFNPCIIYYKISFWKYIRYLVCRNSIDLLCNKSIEFLQKRWVQLHITRSNSYPMNILSQPNQGGTTRVAVVAPLPGNFSENPSWQEISLRTFHVRKLGVDKSEDI